MAERPATRLRSESLLWFAWLVVCGGCGGGADATSSQPSLLSGLAPTEVHGVDEPARLTDGVVSPTGDGWRSSLTSVMHGRAAQVTWDLGVERAIEAAHIQGDNNDRFLLELSSDGKRYKLAWEAPAVTGAGMRSRSVDGLGLRARYVRLRAIGGDARVSAAELSVYADRPTAWPPRLVVGTSRAHDERPWRSFMVVLALLSVFVGLSDRRLPRLLRGLSWLLPVTALAVLGYALQSYQPLVLREIGVLRMVVSGVALACLLRLWLAPAEVLPRRVDAVLALMAVIALACFHNLGNPQFDNVAGRSRTHVHTYDMRVYYPVAKYFDELGFDGLYFASVAAYRDGAAGATEQNTRNVKLRDLRTNRIVKARDVAEEINSASDHFSPARWRAFVDDMRFFWETMGRNGYLGSLRDHGGNATPVWLSIVHTMFSPTTAGETLLLWTALLDPLLFLGLCLAIHRAFGLRSMLLCAIVFGTTDFPQFGSNWVGATLRSDWMAYLGFGLCALKVGRPGLGGALLAFAAMVRAFPALAVIFLPVPALLWWVMARRAGRGVDIRAWLREQAALVRATVGAVVTVVVLVVASGSILGFVPAWGGWIEKIAMHAEKPNINHMGLRTVVAFDRHATASRGGNWVVTQRRTLSDRRLLHYGGMAIFGVLAVLAAVGRSLPQAALLGMMFIPIIFYPANYYLHCVFLLPMLADDTAAGRNRGGLLWVGAVMLALSFAQYFTYHLGWTDVRFHAQSVMLLIAFMLILCPMAWQGVGRLRAGA